MLQTDFLFIYGRTPHLARYEARIVYPNASFTQITDECDWVQGIDIQPSEIMKRLGGIIRVAKEIQIVPEATKDTISEAIKADISGQTHINFIISVFGDLSVPNNFPKLIKQELQQKEIIARFMLPTGDHVASAAQVSKRDVTEYLLIKIEKGIVLARTLAVQDSSSWSHRDYERPIADAKRGMLPLKVARMVVNIAVGEVGSDKTCADPFCGMGTIPGEGLLLGTKWYASDVSPEAIEGTQRNLHWLSGQYNLEANRVDVFVCDAVHLSQKIPELSLDAIVTEPFLGNPAIGEGKITQQKDISNILKGLEKLYIGCLKEWYPLLKHSGKIVIALPVIKRGEHKETVKKLIDSCENLGYSIEAGPFIYSRPDAIVQRNFFVFRKGNKPETSIMK